MQHLTACESQTRIFGRFVVVASVERLEVTILKAIEIFTCYCVTVLELWERYGRPWARATNQSITTRVL